MGVQFRVEGDNGSYWWGSNTQLTVLYGLLKSLIFSLNIVHI